MSGFWWELGVERGRIAAVFGEYSDDDNNISVVWITAGIDSECLAI